MFSPEAKQGFIASQAELTQIVKEMFTRGHPEAIPSKALEGLGMAFGEMSRTAWDVFVSLARKYHLETFDPRRISFKTGTKARKKRGEIAEALKRSGKVRSPFAVATATVKKMKLDPWEDPRFSMAALRMEVDILYMTREEIERQHSRGLISNSDYEKYWKGTGSKHLEEIALRVPRSEWPKLRKWIMTWRHKGGEWIDENYYAMRCGGANQSQDPLNVFFIGET